MQPFEYNIPSISPSDEFLASLIPYSSNLIESFHISRSTKSFLSNTGLPIHSQLYLPGSDLLFYEIPKEINFNSPVHNNFLLIGELTAFNQKIAINMNRGGVFTIGYGESRFFNSSIEKFVQCLGCWLFFYKLETEYVEKYEKTISGFFEVEYEELLFSPIKSKIAEIDPKAMKQIDYNWPLFCCADTGA